MASGNFVVAQPLGVIDGVDHGHTGSVRRVHDQAIRARLDAGEIVLLSPLGCSTTGEVFNVTAEEVAVAAATALRANKLVFLSEAGVMDDAEGHSLHQLTPDAVRERLPEFVSKPDLQRQLRHAVSACEGGVRRVHLVSRARDGGLLLEFFTRDGIGNLITAEAYDDIRAARIDDVGGILRLIAPLEADGVLVRRSRESIELAIDRFAVLERDGMIIACAALFPDTASSMAELSCLAVSQDYQGENRGEQLLQRLEREARQLGIGQIFVLTTRTAHWFQERGFKPGCIEDLPVARQQLYNFQRNSKVFVKSLDAP